MTVIEEAQQILGSQASSNSVQGMGDPRAAAVQNFANAVSTLRSFGEGIVMSTQRPVELHPQAIANTANRIVLHLEEADDRDAVLRSFDVDEQTGRVAARLAVGEALARWPGRDEVEVIHVVADRGVDPQLIVSDEQLAVHMSDHRSGSVGILPYQMCTLEVCQDGCDAKRRRLGSQLAKGFDGASDPSTTLSDVAMAAHGEVRLAYCCAVHLAVQDVIVLTPEVAQRTQLVEAVRKACT